MLLQHAWLAPLVKPATIVEEDEEEAEAAAAADAEPKPSNVADSQVSSEASEGVFDKEVADWVKDAIDKRKRGVLGKGAPKPALHAAPLDAMSSPSKTDPTPVELTVGGN